MAFVRPQSPETQHGAILALGYMVGRYISRKKPFTSSDPHKGQPMNISSQEDDDLVPMATKTIGL